jgi:chlorite dismutase
MNLVQTQNNNSQKPTADNYEKARAQVIQAQLLPDLQKAGSEDEIKNILTAYYEGDAKLGAQFFGNDKSFKNYLEKNKKGVLFQTEIDGIASLAARELGVKKSYAMAEQNADLSAQLWGRATTDEEKQDIQNQFKAQIADMKTASYYSGDKIESSQFSEEQKQAIFKRFDAQANRYDIERRIDTNAQKALVYLKEGDFLMDADTKQKYIAFAEKKAQEQTEQSVYQWAVANYTKPDGDGIDYRAAIEGTKNLPEKNGKLTLTNKQNVVNLLQAEMAKGLQVQHMAETKAKDDALNNAYKFILDGDVKNAVYAVRYSDIGAADKFEIISKFKEGFRKATADDPDFYNDMMSAIVNGDITDNTPILAALAEGKIREATKDAMIQTLEQKQKPAFQVYKSAAARVKGELGKGLFGQMTRVESEALSYVNRDLNAMYNNALIQKKTLPEIEAIFSPDIVSALIDKYSPSQLEVINASMAQQLKTAAAKPAEPQAKPGQSVEDYLKEK